MRSAAIAKRKKNIANINYTIIQEKERFTKEHQIKKRELANFENSEIIRKQVNLWLYRLEPIVPTNEHDFLAHTTWAPNTFQ